MSDNAYSIYLLGCTAAGKSCFFAGLGVFGELDRGHYFQFTCDDEDRSIIYPLTRSLREGKWPAPTTATRHIRGNLHYERHDFPVQWLDYAGERFIQHFAEGSIESRELPEELMKADYLLLVLDPQQDLKNEDDFGTREDRVRYKDRLDALINAVAQFRLEHQEKEVQIGVLITKGDLIFTEEANRETARKYLQTHAPQLFNKLNSLFKDIPVFALSAVGNTELVDNSPIPQPAEKLNPWGYDQIFDWVVKDILHKMGAPRRRQRNLAVILISTVLMLGAVAYYGFKQVALENALKMSSQLLDEGDSERFAKYLRQAPVRNANEIIDNMLNKIGNLIIDSSASDTDLRNAEHQLNAINGRGTFYKQRETEELMQTIREKLENHNFEIVLQAFQQNQDYVRIALQFKDNYPNSNYNLKIDEMLEKKQKSEIAKSLDALINTKVDSRSSLQSFSKALKNFSSQYPGKMDKSAITAAYKADELASILESQGGLPIRLKKLGTTPNDRGYFTLKIYTNSYKEEVFSQQSSSQLNYWTFDNDTKEFLLKWDIGDRIDLEVWRDRGKLSPNRKIASKTFRGNLAVANLAETVSFDKEHDDVKFFTGHTVKLDVEVVGWPQESWDLLNKWIFDKSEYIQLSTQYND